MSDAKVINLFDERWIESVFNEKTPEGGLRVDVSTKGRVRFTTTVDLHGVTLSMKQMMELGKALTRAYDDDEGESNG